jgi:UPF0755 protein
MRVRQKRRQASPLALRLLLMMLAAAACLVAAIVLPAALLAGPARSLGPGSPDLNVGERAALLAYLTSRSRDLSKPAGSDPRPVVFSVEPGATASSVADRLETNGLVLDSRLLAYYLRYQGMDRRVEAGDFVLRQTMTIPEVARALTDAMAREVVLRVTEGWRIEQIAESLLEQRGLSDAYQDFLMLAGPNGPRPGGYDVLAELPPGASLEGYLFPDTYLVRPDATAGQIIDKMLSNFQARLPPNYRAQVAARGLTLHQAITMASLIEREAAVETERALIASVMYNRLAVGQRLEIDATVQYALGQSGNWWPRLDGIDLRAVTSPYNTYAHANLPAGPIANPGLSSILAVSEPAETNYFFYRALCNGSGGHAFAVTYEEHLANACR